MISCLKNTVSLTSAGTKKTRCIFELFFKVNVNKTCMYKSSLIGSLLHYVLFLFYCLCVIWLHSVQNKLNINDCNFRRCVIEISKADAQNVTYFAIIVYMLCNSSDCFALADRS